MAPVAFENIYSRVLTRVLETTHIKGLKKGVLYSAIAVILKEENLEDQERTKAICEYLSIRESASIDDDYNLVVSSLINMLSIEPDNHGSGNPFVNMFSNVFKEIDKNNKNEDDKMKWIIIGACVIAGFLACVQYLMSKRSPIPLSEDQRLFENNPLPPTPVIPVALCLVVTASEIDNLYAQQLSQDGLFHLIDSASYFLCTDIQRANEHEKLMETIPIQEVNSGSKQDIYIRVFIGDGYRLKDTRIRYKIKDNLPVQESYKIEKIACLGSLSGIEKLIRV